jgi:hypothetical protein
VRHPVQHCVLQLERVFVTLDRTMPATKHRISTVVTPELEEAVDAAPEAQLVDRKAGEAERLRAWAVYGYRTWQAEKEREIKLAAYQELAADDERREAIRQSNLQAADAGLL